LRMVVQAFQLKRMHTRSEIDCVPTRVWPYLLPGSKARQMLSFSKAKDDFQLSN
jgi:hypothetical protein